MIEFLRGCGKSKLLYCLANLGHTQILGPASEPCSQGSVGAVLFEHQSLNTNICVDLFDPTTYSLSDNRLLWFDVTNKQTLNI